MDFNDYTFCFAFMSVFNTHLGLTNIEKKYRTV